VGDLGEYKLGQRDDSEDVRMPYFITDQQADCDGWATVKEEDGALLTIGCHASKQEAIDQMVAVSLAEDMQPGGERDLNGPAAIVVDIDGTLIADNGDPIQNVVAFVREYTGAVLIVTARREARRDETIAQLDAIGVDYELLQMRGDRTPEVVYKAAVIKNLFANYNVELAIDNNADVRAEYARIGVNVLAPSGVDPQELPQMLQRAVDLSLPDYIMEAAARGLEYHAAGLSGDGVVDRTIREARLMADGQVSEDKVIRTNAWAARHLIDLEVDNNHDPEAEGFPGAGAVAFYLWGIDPLDPQPAIDWFQRKASDVKNEARAIGDTYSDRQVAMIEDLMDIADEYGEWDQSSLGNGAHYAPGADNPFRASGLMCQNCHFYQASENPDEPGACELVAGVIEPEAICKLWVIPEQKIVEPNRSLDNLRHMTDKGVEIRRITVNEFEIRDGAGDGMHFSGYAAVFNSPSEPLPFIERIAPGAFANSLSSRNEIKMFVNHDTTRVLASKRAGTLRLSEDAHGLRVEADLPPTTDGKDLAILMQRGDVDSMSFGFSVPAGGDSWSNDGSTRQLNEVRLHEVSIVTAFPAYTATSAGVRSLDNLAAATGADIGLLDAAITKLEAGETLDEDAAMLIDSVVQKLRADTTIGDEAKASLDMKRKQLDLLFSRV
jgi:HK97 family phage prohead protease